MEVNYRIILNSYNLHTLDFSFLVLSFLLGFLVIIHKDQVIMVIIIKAINILIITVSVTIKVVISTTTTIAIAITTIVIIAIIGIISNLSDVIIVISLSLMLLDYQ